MENMGSSKETAEDLFFKFMDAEDCPEITQTFSRLIKLTGIKANNSREFYTLLKGKLQTWRCKSLWEQLDSRANQKEYGKGKICEDHQVMIIGAGPIGLRTAIEIALLGAQVVIVEKRESFVRNNVLHLWPFLLTDFRSLGAKKFYGKFCSGSIDHISIRRLQAILLKCALIFGAKLYTGVTFEHVIEPNSPEEGWKSKLSPDNHPLNTFEFDVLIGADGKKNVLPGFQQIEMRGTLAIGITANFVNHGTEEEANVEEISGIAYQFNPQFFDTLLAEKGIKLENIVYYKDETHYFVMTAGKASLVKRGALKEDLGQPAKLLAPSNIDSSKLLEYVTDVVKYATKGTLRNLELKKVKNNQPDIAAFDFTSIKKAEHAARIIERKGSKLLVGLVGDSLLEPFWPTGSGCARGVLSALDAAWMVRSFAQDKPPLQILSERENIYRLLSGTSAENLHKDHAKYTINPSSRYLHIAHKKVREVYHLFDTDDAVNADFSLGSPAADVNDKTSRRRRISTGAKLTSAKGRKRSQANNQLTAEARTRRLRSTSGSSLENLDEHKPLGVSRSGPLDSRKRSNEVAVFSSAGSDEEFLDSKSRTVPRKVAMASPLRVRERRSTVGSSNEARIRKRKKSRTKEKLENTKGDTTRRKKSFFGFGRTKSKHSANEQSDHHSDKESNLVKAKHDEEHHVIGSRDDSSKRKPAGPFSRSQYTRRSTRDIIKEMEARSKSQPGGNNAADNERVSGKMLESNSREKNDDIKNSNSFERRELGEKPKIKKEDEKKRQKEDEKKRKEEERRKKEEEKKKQEEGKQREKEERKKKDEEKRRFEEDKKMVEEEERARKKIENEVKKREQANNMLNKKTQTTPINKKFKKQALLDEIAKLSPTAKRAIPVISKLSPDKGNEKSQEVNVATAVGEAAVILMATPLLIDRVVSTQNLTRTGSRFTKGSGRVRDVVQRYNTLNDMKPLIKSMNGDVTPLRKPRDFVEGPVNEKPKQFIIDQTVKAESKGSPDRNCKDSFDATTPTPPSQKKKILQMKKDGNHLVSSPSLERLKFKLLDSQDEIQSPAFNKDGESPNKTEKTRLDFNSPIWQETPLVAIMKESKGHVDEVVSVDDKSEGETILDTNCLKKEAGAMISPKTEPATAAENSEETKDKDKEASRNEATNWKISSKDVQSTKMSQARRRSSMQPIETMEDKLRNLINSTATQKAWDSIKYMISLLKEIQKNPKEEKFHRIFKGRTKFRKHVWAIRNAKLFMTTSGWTEVGSFLIFPLSKSTEQPLLMLHKYLGIVDEKRPEDNNSTAMAKGLCFQKTASCPSELAGKLMELKQALTSSRSSSYNTRRLSLERNTKLLRFRRTMSVDEVNISSRAEEEFASSTKSVDSKNKEDERRQIEDPSLKGNERNTNLRRCVSENVLLTLPEGSDDYTVTSPVIRNFSQRRVVEQETVYDLVMENPIELNISSAPNSVEKARKASSLPDKGSAENSKIKSTGTKRNSVHSRNENALKEADKLSSVLDNILDTLGDSSDSERETDSGKEMTKTAKEARVPCERTADQFKDDAELDTLSRALDLIIQDNTSESASSENGGDLNGNEQPYKLRKRRDDAKCSLKPPVHPGRRTTKHLEKTKRFDKSKQASLINGNLDREKLSKSKSVDVRSVTSNRRSRQKLSAETSQLRTVSRSPVKTRAQRQRETKNSRSVLETSNRNQVISKKHDSVVTAKRPVAKGKSVDMNRHRTRHESLVKSKSLGNQRNETKGTEQRRKRFSSRSSNSEDDMKAVKSGEAETKHAQQCEKEENRAVMASNEENEKSSLETPKETEEQPNETEENRRKVEVDHNELRNGQVAFSEQDETGRFSHRAEGATEREQEAVAQDDSIKEFEDVKEQNSDETFHAERDEVNATQREKLDEIVELSNEIQFHFSESVPPQPKENVCLNTQGNSGDKVVKQCLSISGPVAEIDQDNLLIHNDNTGSHVKENRTLNETDNSPTESYSQTDQSHGRKMTLLDIGKQQSRERLARKNGPITQLTLEERKQLIIGSVDSTPKAKPANKRRSILQIKSRNGGNLVKNKKDAFENATRTSAAVTNGSLSKSAKRRYFRFHGRERKSFEFSSDHLGAVLEDNEGELGEGMNEMAPSKGTQAVLALSGATADSAKTLNDFDDEGVEKNDEGGNVGSSLNRSPFQFRFRTRRRGFYDLKKRADATGIRSVEDC